MRKMRKGRSEGMRKMRKGRSEGMRKMRDKYGGKVSGEGGRVMMPVEECRSEDISEERSRTYGIDNIRAHSCCTFLVAHTLFSDSLCFSWIVFGSGSY